ncbi:ATP-grasp domain-containing protein [Subtercola lobariae]|uniref:Glutathione synthase n=1 Tax=Subtercola lobariae TaxID=1588641 RepID=A0A917B6D1_9MICO|nr:alpha-L-glutamate ligase [Subtercola lobariae]GGF21918.1 glutathione synthase [Subtercola lobariae]
MFIVHENSEWLPPLLAAFEAEDVPVSEIVLSGGSIDLGSAPEPGIYWSRLSASSHTRDHADAKEYARAVFSWLQSNGARVVNGRQVVEVEVSKVQQHQSLVQAGFDVPRTSAVFGRAELKGVARTFDTPFITKHNQGGKGLGVRRFDTHEAFETYVDSAEFEASPDGITLIQEYLVAAEPFVTRVEFVGGKYVYAVRVDISAGSFELCPADACEVPLFTLRAGFDDDPLIARYEQFLEAQGIEIAGIEFIETADGRRVTYDINTNTNYNSDVEASSDRSGPRSIARYLKGLLAERYGQTGGADASSSVITIAEHPATETISQKVLI